MRQIVSLSCTSRPENYTVRALSVVNDELRVQGAEPIMFDGRKMELAFPGQPSTKDANKLRGAIEGATGVILATPEYHGSFSAMAKLFIENLGFPSALSGKPVALLGVAAGRIGAIKSIEHLKGVCSHVGAIVVPGAVSVAGVQSVFGEDGACTDPGTEKALRGLAHALLAFIKDYVCPRFAMEEMVRSGAKPWSTNI